MKLNCNFSNDKPIYLQIVEQIKVQIVSGELKKGEKLDSVRDIAAMLRVNPNTVQRALSELEGTELVFAQRTSGRFVTGDVTLIENMREETAQCEIAAFLGNMERLGFERKNVIEMLRRNMNE